MLDCRLLLDEKMKLRLLKAVAIYIHHTGYQHNSTLNPSKLEVAAAGRGAHHHAGLEGRRRAGNLSEAIKSGSGHHSR